MNAIKKVLKFENVNNIGLLGMTNEFFALYANEVFNNNKSVLIVTPSLYEANKIYNSVVQYNSKTLLFQVDDILLSSNATFSPELKTERLNTIHELLEDSNKLVITDLAGFLTFLPSPSLQHAGYLSLKVNDEYDISLMLEKLIDMGYHRESLVTETGEIGVRGFVLDVFPVGEEYPIRIEFFGDTIESIRYFDPNTQKSLDILEQIDIKPNSFLAISNEANILSYLNDPVVIYKDYDQLKITYERMVQDSFYDSDNDGELPFFDFSFFDTKKNLYYLDFDSKVSDLKIDYVDFRSCDVPTFREDIEAINSYLKEQIANGKTVILCLNYISQHFLDALSSSYVLSNIDDIILNTVNVIKFPMVTGFSCDEFVFLTEYELFQRKKEVKRKVNFKFATRIKDLSQIQVGDYVVHTQHGIGIYNGLKTISKNGVLADYLEVSYAKGDKLYIPASKIELISKYSSKEGYVPKLNSLNSTTWAKTKQRVREKIKYEASRLIRVQAERQLKQGFAFSVDSPMQAMFEAEFPYELTDDQEKAIQDIKRDMENIVPMDRILCGDVGYGKTEVAFRAMFKAVLDSKQVLYLCPTTLLCKQQYESAVARFKNYPVKIASFSRYTTVKEANAILDGVKEGTIDIVFGTHRLLTDAVKPKNLGLLVIDEEQRFGVAHKEKIKEFKADIDVLTLTATPIPRTLQMSMLGLKQLSLIETAPKNRHPVQTYVVPYDTKLIRDIIYKEISRTGQVFILYNRVEDIEVVYSQFKRLAPDASIVYAHGRMSKEELEDRMNSFIQGEYDVLLCTTIIETGIDIPNANSLIILNADRFGLAQLYQIRGRVGRSDRVAYAYLMYDKSKVLTESAMKRLKVIKDFTALGSGFQIATRDLSIRGAGDILGSEQAGFIDSVGIDLYMKMLQEEVMRLKGCEPVSEDDVVDNSSLNVSTHISDDYMPNDSLKIEIHKMIHSIDSYEKFILVREELKDRFGKIPSDIDLYMNQELFDYFVKAKGIEKVNDNSLYMEIIFSKEKSQEMSYENIFVNSLSVNNKFVFDYKNLKISIKLVKKDLDTHPVFYFNRLLMKV